MKISFIEIGGCGGCSLTFMRGSSNLPDNCEIVYFPLTLDVGEPPEETDIIFISGSVCVQDDESVELIASLREKVKTIVSFGSCAAVGGIMRFFIRGGQEPKPWQATHLPLGQFIAPDLSVVGCPPSPQTISRLISSLSDAGKDIFNPYKKLTQKTRLSCFDLLDDVTNMQLCVGCRICEKVCPSLAIQIVDKLPEFIVERCIRCGVCYAHCPQLNKKWKKEDKGQPSLQTNLKRAE